jgi:hypothetical protein
MRSRRSYAPTLLPVPLKAEVGARTGGARAETLVVGGSRVGLRYAADGYRLWYTPSKLDLLG